MTWILLGGPRHDEQGTGTVPDGYEFEGAGDTYSIAYDMSVRDADEVYRWSEDVRDIRDGHRLLDGIKDGSIQFPESLHDAVEWGFSAFQQSLYALKDQPQSDFAQDARDTLDRYRRAGVL